MRALHLKDMILKRGLITNAKIRIFLYMIVVYFSTFAWFCGEFHHTGEY